MKITHTLRSLALTALLAICAMPAMAQSLTTTYDGGNGQDGNMFDLTPVVDLTVDSFDLNLEAESGATVPIEIYWRVGTVEDNQFATEGWTLLGSADVTSQGIGNPTPVPIGGLALSAGQTYGIYIRTVDASGLDYTDGVEGQPVVVANDDLTLTSFYGIQNGGESTFPASEDFFPRLWNGTVYYTADPTTTCASEGYTGAKLIWCQNICEKGYTGKLLDSWIHRWINRYRTLPACAMEEEEEEEEQQGG